MCPIVQQHDSEVYPTFMTTQRCRCLKRTEYLDPYEAFGGVPGIISRKNMESPYGPYELITQWMICPV